MDFNEYQKLAARTDEDMGEEMGLLNSVMGMAGEAAEALEHIKKVLFQGHRLDKGKLIVEGGDTLWYIAKLARLCGINLEELAKANIEKLKRRYPDGFDTDKSIYREE